MDFLKKSRGTFWTVASLATIAGIAYYLKMRKQRPIARREIVPIDDKQKRNIFDSLKAEYDEKENILTIDSLMSVMNGVFEYALPDHIQLMLKNRKDRREKYENLEAYIASYVEYFEAVKALETKAREEMLTHINVEDAMWEKSLTYYNKKKNKVLLEFYKSYYPTIKLSIGSTVILDEEELTHTLNEARANMIHEAQAIRNLLITGREVPYIRDITETRAYDFLYLTFDLEEEDLIKNIEAHYQNKQIRDLYSAFEQSIESINRISSMLA